MSDHVGAPGSSQIAVHVLGEGVLGEVVPACCTVLFDPICISLMSVCHGPRPKATLHVGHAKKAQHVLLCNAHSTLCLAVEGVLVSSHRTQSRVDGGSPHSKRGGQHEFCHVIVPNYPCSQPSEIQKLLEVGFLLLSVLCQNSPGEFHPMGSNDQIVLLLAHSWMDSMGKIDTKVYPAVGPDDFRCSFTHCYLNVVLLHLKRASLLLQNQLLTVLKEGSGSWLGSASASGQGPQGHTHWLTQ
eukprot:2997650-Rhodomonas_salina.3